MLIKMLRKIRLTKVIDVFLCKLCNKQNTC
jgi:hypothetical protein